MKRDLERTYRSLFKNFRSLSVIARDGMQEYRNRIPLSHPQILQTFAPSSSIQHIINVCDDISSGAIEISINGSPLHANILMRSVLEATLKIAKICRSEDPMSATNEFFVNYFEALVAQEASKTSAANQATEKNWLVHFSSLGDRSEVPEYFSRLQSENPRESRKKMLNAWTAGRILQDLKSDPAQDKMADMLIFLYNVLSHLAHVDPCGLRLNYLEVEESDEERRLRELSQVVDILMSVIALSKVRTSFLCHAFLGTQLDSSPVLPKAEKELAHVAGVLRLRQSFLRLGVKDKMNQDEFRKFLASHMNNLLNFKEQV